jgi:hypothetical protein
MAKYEWMDHQRNGNIQKELKTDSILEKVSKYRTIWIST